MNDPRTFIPWMLCFGMAMLCAFAAENFSAAHSWLAAAVVISVLSRSSKP